MICPFCKGPAHGGIVGNDPPFPVLLCDECGRQIADWYGLARALREGDKLRTAAGELRAERDVLRAALRETLPFASGPELLKARLALATTGETPTIRITAITEDAPTGVTRLEVIEENGRTYTRWNCRIQFSYQDDGRTLKIFVAGRDADERR